MLIRAATLRSVLKPLPPPNSTATQSPPAAKLTELAPAGARSLAVRAKSTFPGPHELHALRSENRTGKCCAARAAPGARPERFLNSGADRVALHQHQTPAQIAPGRPRAVRRAEPLRPWRVHAAQFSAPAC